MSDWISVSDKEPPCGKKVLATYRNSQGHARIIVGEYIRRWEIESDSDDEEQHDEYNEEKGTYYLCEGWYEQQENLAECSSIYVMEGEVTHWMPLPSVPGYQPGWHPRKRSQQGRQGSNQV